MKTYLPFILLIPLLVCVGHVRGQSVAELIRAVGPGETLTLPAGTYALGSEGLRIPPGVSIEGAGVGETELDASKAQVGIFLEGGTNTTIRGLTVRGASDVGIDLKTASRVRLSNLRVTGGMTGIRVNGVRQGRIENTILDGNGYGLILQDSEDVVVVNNTVADCSEIGLGLISGQRLTVFNNLIAGAALGVNIGEVTELSMDRNLYHVLVVGNMLGQIPRRDLETWSYMSGYDRHSIFMPVTFADPSVGDFTPVNRLSWSHRAVTDQWGTALLAGEKAPSADIFGKSWEGRPDLGAVRAPGPAEGKEDGTFTISQDIGVKSAGLFDAQGNLLAYLFSNLPLPAGKYTYQLPSRDWAGRPVEPGDYELRLVESRLDWELLGTIGDTGEYAPAGYHAAVMPGPTVFAGGRVLMAQGWSEDHTNLRAYDPVTGRTQWTFFGAAHLRGFCLGEDGAVYLMRKAGDQSVSLVRIDPDTGEVAPPWSSGDGVVTLPFEPGGASSIAVFQGRLFLAHPAENRIYITSILSPSLEGKSISIDNPRDLQADFSSGRIWLISGEDVVALNRDGVEEARIQPVKQPMALAARDGTLAIASAATGKIHLFDATEADALRPLRTMGTGDGPYGPAQADRFWFQSDDKGRGASYVYISLGPDGGVTVSEKHRISLFDGTGKAVWTQLGVFGNNPVLSNLDPTHLWNTYGALSFRLDETEGTWALEALWETVAIAHRLYGDFERDGRHFVVYGSTRAVQPYTTLVVAERLPDHRVLPLVAWQRREDNTWWQVFNTNKDGLFDEQDRWEPLISPRGVQATSSGWGQPVYRFIQVQPNGDFRMLFQPGSSGVVSLKEITAEGFPVYDYEGMTMYPYAPNAAVSPYTGAAESYSKPSAAVELPNGEMVYNMVIKGAGGTGMGHNAGTDLVRLDAEGQPRWVRTLGQYLGLEGLAGSRGVLLTTDYDAAKYMLFDEDGQGLGSFSEPAELAWSGYWIDHPENTLMYTGANGETFAIIGDNNGGQLNWYRMKNRDSIQRTVSPVKVAEARAEALMQTPYTRSKSEDFKVATPVIRVPALEKDLPIDGGLEKWRELGIEPQVVMVPTFSRGVDGPEDASAVIRLAHRGQDLYVQILRFDDLVTFHQPYSKSYQQDTVEVMLNGFLGGFQWSVSKYTDVGVAGIRRRFGKSHGLDRVMPQEQMPCVVKVLDSAAEVSERKMIEAIYGISLEAAQVIVTEFKLPITATTYEGDPDAAFSMASGEQAWIGFMIDDNDEPGTDRQNLLVWPATYGTFGPATDSAIMVFE